MPTDKQLNLKGITMTFEKELQTLINRYSQENGSNTPDFILAEYLSLCLKVFNETTNKREKWYGRSEHPVFATCGAISGSLTQLIMSPEFKTQIIPEVTPDPDAKIDHITEKLFKRTLEQFYENTKVKTNAEKIKALKWYMDVRFVTNCDTEEEELEFLEHAFNKGL